MKLKKHLDLKNSKVLMGLFALLFMGSVAQTGAILKTQQPSRSVANQTAQVTTIQNCISVSHDYNTSEPLLSSEDQYLFRAYMNITNNCGYSIRIVNPMGLHLENPITNLKSGRVETLGQNNTPVVIPNLTSSEYGINTYAELLDCMLCQPSETNEYVSPAGRNGSLRAASLESGQSRTFAYVFLASVPNNPSYLFRLRPLNLKWFRTSALSDGIVQSSEIQTLNFGRAQSAELATDFIRIQQAGGGSGLIEQDVKNPIKTEVKDLSTKVQ